MAGEGLIQHLSFMVVRGFEFRVLDLLFRVQGLGFKVWGLGFRVLSLGFSA